MPDLTGRAAIVTGSTKGIGLAIAEQLAHAGASVAVSARSEGDVADVAARLAEESVGQIVGLPCDIRDPNDCARLIDDAVELLGSLDILVNNAGLGIFDSIQDLSVEDWQTQIETNLGGVFYCSKSAIPHLSATGDGWIINIGSLAGRNTFAGGTGYNASKFGLLGMTEAMMLDVRYDDVRVSLIMPGSVNTYFRGREQAAERDWRLEADDCALAVMQLLDFPKQAHVSRVEMRPSQPKRG